MAGRLCKKLRRKVACENVVLLLMIMAAVVLVYISTQPVLRGRGHKVDADQKQARIPVPQENLWGQPHEGRTKPRFHGTGGAASMEARIAKGTQRCQSKDGNHLQGKAVKKCDLFSPSRSAAFCPVAKIASTFWVRLFKVLERNPNSTVLESPFVIPLGMADGQRCVNASKTSFKRGKIFKGTFVREPFSRVFSAYVDKLVSPNPIFWGYWGKSAMKLDGVDKDSMHCGESVTFRQFLRQVNNELYRSDLHIIPYAAQCDHCKHKFDFIGKMETFSEDLKYFLSALNLTFQKGVQLSQETKLDAIYDTIQGPFSWRENTLKCVSSAEMGRRIWRKLQIRGLISSEIDYPFGLRDLRNMTTAYFYQTAVKAHEKSTNKTLLAKQKHQAMVEAYRTVPWLDIEKYLELFKDDFEVFSYDQRPAFVFDRTESDFVDTDAFNFDAPWRMS